MTWKLFLDDQINDPETPVRHCPEGFEGAESVAEAQTLVDDLGCPSFVDLDHDLGDGQPTGMDFLKWLSNNYPDNPPAWNIHSANVCGAANMDSFLKSWARVVEGTNEKDSE
jgi:hypothetical protein